MFEEPETGPAWEIEAKRELALGNKDNAIKIVRDNTGVGRQEIAASLLGPGALYVALTADLLDLCNLHPTTYPDVLCERLSNRW